MRLKPDRNRDGGVRVEGVGDLKMQMRFAGIARVPAPPEHIPGCDPVVPCESIAADKPFCPLLVVQTKRLIPASGTTESGCSAYGVPSR
ncbi:hypothetical protein ABE419_04740 [Brevibacillus agri]